jgi:dGTP triphosphohydrolase
MKETRNSYITFANDSEGKKTHVRTRNVRSLGVKQIGSGLNASLTLRQNGGNTAENLWVP